MFQEHSNNVDRIVSFFKKNLTKRQQNYYYLEKEYLALLLTIHLDVYLNVTVHTIFAFRYHPPFLHKMSKKNQILTRFITLKHINEYIILLQMSCQEYDKYTFLSFILTHKNMLNRDLSNYLSKLNNMDIVNDV